MFDLAINNGKVFSGADSSSKYMNLGITDNKISFLGKEKIEAKKHLDATGYLVTPGFIDLHCHSDLSFLIDPDADSKLTQGVTLELVGNCGMSFCAPLTKTTRSQLQDRMNRMGTNIEVDWFDFEGWLKKIETNVPSINVATQIGHGTLRSAIMGMEARSPSPDEIEQMKKLVEESFDAGALGLSTGLWYAPGSYSLTEEVIELAKVAAKRNILYSSHIRSESNDACGLLPAHAEAIEIGRRSGVRVQISHVKAVGPTCWGRGKELIEGIKKARSEGLDVAGDQYPYPWSSTGISGCMFPRWSLEGGRETTLKRLQDADIREKIKQETSQYIHRFHGPEGCVLADFPPNSDLEGKNLEEISQNFHCSPEEAAMRLYEESEGSFVLHSMNDEDVYDIAKYEFISVASDGNSLRTTGPLSKGKPHPRSYATNSRFIEHMVIEKKVTDIGTAIYRMTGLPAQRLGVTKRGLIKKGFFADLLIFKPEEVNQYATFENPHQYSTGMKYVLVNGHISVVDGEKIPGRFGKVIRSFAD
tara:strand:+ start:1028 stop:2620 length:1593 start_codon:yes stop_codon:yes gene_type:complete